MTQNGDNLPHLDEHGDLVIPFSCADHHYKYWKQEGAPLAEIMAGAGMPEEEVRRLAPPPKKKKKK
jgi:hypothetical protein